MKTLFPASLRRWIGLTVFAAFTGLASAIPPTLISIGVEKFQDYTQTSAATPSVVTGYHFNLAVDGTGLGSLDGALTTPGSQTLGPTSLAPVYFGPYASSNFTGSGPLPTLGDGSYTIAVGNHDADLSTFATAGVNFTGSLYPAYVPTVSGTGLTWSGGSLVANAGVANTFDFNTITSGFAANAFATDAVTPFGGSVTFLISDLSGNLIDGVSRTAFLSESAPASFTLDAFSLTAGTTYNATLEFNVLADVNIASTLADNYGGAAAYALYGTQTHFTITAVPEPAHVAGLLALAALIAVFAARRHSSRRLHVA